MRLLLSREVPVALEAQTPESQSAVDMFFWECPPTSHLRSDSAWRSAPDHVRSSKDFILAEKYGT